jgi:hypothetical protein
MVGDRVATVRAGFAGLGDDGDEVAEVGLFEHARQFARGPEFRTGGLDALDALEGVAGGGSRLCAGLQTTHFTRPQVSTL